MYLKSTNSNMASRTVTTPAPMARPLLNQEGSLARAALLS
jgi:hypothetical protein